MLIVQHYTVQWAKSSGPVSPTRNLKNPPSCKTVKFDLEKSSCKTVKLDLEKVSCRAEERRSRAFTGQVSFRGWAQCTSRSSRCPGWFEETVGFDNFTFHDSRIEVHCPNVQIATLMLRWGPCLELVTNLWFESQKVTSNLSLWVSATSQNCFWRHHTIGWRFLLARINQWQNLMKGNQIWPKIMIGPNCVNQ